MRGFKRVFKGFKEEKFIVSQMKGRGVKEYQAWWCSAPYIVARVLLGPQRQAPQDGHTINIDAVKIAADLRMCKTFS